MFYGEIAARQFRIKKERSYRSSYQHLPYRLLTDRRDHDGGDKWSCPVEVSVAFGQYMYRGEVVFAEQVGQPAKTPAQNHHIGSRKRDGELLRWSILVLTGIRIRFELVMNQLPGVETMPASLVEVELNTGAILAGRCIAVVFRERYGSLCG